MSHVTQRVHDVLEHYLLGSLSPVWWRKVFVYEKRNGIEISSYVVKVFMTLLMSHVTYRVILEASSKWSFDDHYGSF